MFQWRIGKILWSKLWKKHKDIWKMFSQKCLASQIIKEILVKCEYFSLHQVSKDENGFWPQICNLRGRESSELLLRVENSCITSRKEGSGTCYTVKCFLLQHTSGNLPWEDECTLLLCLHYWKCETILMSISNGLVK